MNQETKDSLEWEKIKDQLLGQCFSEEGRGVLGRSDFLTDIEALKTLQGEVSPFLRLCQRQNPLPFLDFPTIERSLETARVQGSVLDGPSLKNAGTWLSSAHKMAEFLDACEEPSLAPISKDMLRFPELAHRLGQYFDAEGNLLEDLVPALRILNREKNKVRSEMGSKAEELLKREDSRDIWQSQVPTQKDGRVLLALKSNFKGRMAGIVHESSGSGATLFFEPLELVEKNNRLAEIHHEYQREIHKLLLGLTQELRDHWDGIQVLRTQIGRLDGWGARARLGHLHRGEFPVLSAAAENFSLSQARHPLLGSLAVPIDLSPGTEIQALLISGPNTGGKTATLKTAGLLALMNQFGIPIPASPDSVLPLFDNILCDIGDGQSLEGHLSTFSSHMRRIALILERATPFSLVLLDELGSGTDPEEGGALSVALLEELLSLGPRILVTTHHSRLKEFALAQPRVSNASVEFDQDARKPTYRILPGLPGSSHAMEIARQQGIPEALVERALAVQRQGETEASTIIKKLREEELRLRTLEKDLEGKVRAAQEAQRNADLKFLKVKQTEVELRDHGLGEFRRFLKESRSLFEGLVRQIREKGKASPEEIKEARDFFQNQELRLKEDETQLLSEQEALGTLRGPDQKPPEEWKPGQEVWLEAGSKKGTLLSVGPGPSCVVSVGSMRWTVRKDQLRLVEGVQAAPKVQILTMVESDQSPVFTLDIRGHRWEEAREKLETQIDRSLMKGLETFQIIHGLGEGVLQKNVQEYLRSRREVQRFHFALPEEGGFGKTIVYL